VEVSEMTLILDLSHEDEMRLEELARQRGMAPAEAALQLVVDHLPPVADGNSRIDGENAAAIAFLRRRIGEEASSDPREIANAEAEVEEMKRDLNANRAETGERLLFP
jgi:hypothetical protein